MSEPLMDFLFDASNAPFTISIIVMLGLGLVEAVGLGLSGIDVDLPVFDHGGALDWLKIGEVPLLITLISFLTLFGVSGLLIQQVTGGIPLLFAVPLALAVSIPLLGFTSAAMVKVVPLDETYVTHPDEFVGKRAKLLSTASPDVYAKATLTDQHETTHYLLVRAHETTLQEGDECILWKREGNAFVAIPTFENGGLKIQ